MADEQLLTPHQPRKCSSLSTRTVSNCTSAADHLLAEKISFSLAKEHIRRSLFKLGQVWNRQSLNVTDHFRFI